MYVVVFDDKDSGVEVDPDRYTQDEQYRAQVHAALTATGCVNDRELQEAIEAVTELVRALIADNLDDSEMREAPLQTSRLQ